MENPRAIDVLAGAYAANGDFSEAVKWEQKALEMKLPDDGRAEAEKRLKLFQENKPYRETGR